MVLQPFVALYHPRVMHKKAVVSICVSIFFPINKQIKRLSPSFFFTSGKRRGSSSIIEGGYHGYVD